MKTSLSAAFALIAVLFICCRKDIPDPPLSSQVNGIPASNGPCTASFYSTVPNRIYTLTVDGTWQGTVNGASFSPACGGSGTVTFHLAAGSHTVYWTWTDNITYGTGSFSFSLSGPNCQLYQLQ